MGTDTSGIALNYMVDNNLTDGAQKGEMGQFVPVMQPAHTPNTPSLQPAHTPFGQQATTREHTSTQNSDASVASKIPSWKHTITKGEARGIPTAAATGLAVAGTLIPNKPLAAAAAGASVLLTTDTAKDISESVFEGKTILTPSAPAAGVF